jgi:hypothetical protein
MLRQFFDPEYNSDISAIQDFSDNKESFVRNEMLIELFSDVRGTKKLKRSQMLIPFDDNFQSDEVMNMFFVIMNVLVQTAPTLHYSML